MQKKSIALFVVCGLVAAMFFFSLGIVTSRPAQAQPIYSKLSNFPRQSELWSVWSNDSSAWLYVNSGFSGFEFTVSRDAVGRLPVLTALHNETYTFNNSDYGTLYKEVDGTWHYVERSHDIFYASSGIASAAAFRESRLHDSPGVILLPGRYLIKLDASREHNHQLLATGYMALP